MAKRKKKRQIRPNESPVNYEEIGIKHTRIQTWFSAISLVMAIVSIVISIVVAVDTHSLEYNQNLPNLNMSVTWSSDDETGAKMLSYQILNDGGKVRESTIIPHMYLTYICSPDFEVMSSPDFDMSSSELSGEIESSCIIELRDFFAPHYGNGLYYSSVIPYNAKENSWFFEIEKSRLDEGLAILDLAGTLFWDRSDTMFGLNLCLEVDYVDVMGNRHVEWYDATSELFYDISDAHSYSSSSALLSKIDQDSQIPLQEYQAAVGINLDEYIKDGSVICDEDTITAISQWCYEALLGSAE